MPAADAPIRAPARRRPRPKRTPAAAIRHATARGPQGLPIQSKSPQRARPVRPLTRTTRGPQGLRIQHHTPQKPRQKPLRSLPHPKPKPSGRAQRLNATGGGYEAALRRGQRERKNNNTAAANVLMDFLRADRRGLGSILGAIGATTHIRPSGTRSVVEIGSSLGIKNQTGRTVERELTGKGEFAKALQHISQHVDVKPGGQKTAVERAGFPVSDSDAAHLVRRGIQDFVNLGATALPSVYVPAKAAVDYAKTGNPREIKKFWRDVKANDPVVNLAMGNTRKALRLANEHPGFALLEGTGVLKGAGRGTGAVIRHAPSRTLRQLGSTTRTHLTEDGTAIVQHRAYSKNPFAKAKQVNEERAARETVRNLRDQAEREMNKGHEERAAELLRKAHRKDPDRIGTHEIRTQVTEHFSAREEIRRHRQAKALATVDEIIHGTTRRTRASRAIQRARGKETPENLARLNRHEREALPFVAQRIVSTNKDDIRNYIHELEAEHPLLDTAGRKLNEATRDQLQRVVDGKVRPERVQEAARRYQKISQDLQQRLINSHLLTKEEADLARLTPYAVRNMGARFDQEAGVLMRKGRELKVETIRAHMKAKRVEEPAFLSQAPRMGGGSPFGARAERAQKLRTDRRTGAATVRGTYDPHPEVLRTSAARAQGLSDAVEGWKGFVHGFTRKEEGSPEILRGDRKAIQREVDNLNAKEGGGDRWTAIRIHPFAAQKNLKEFIDAPEVDQMTGLHELLDQALQGKGEGGDWAIVPKVAADELRDHLNAMGPGANMKAWAFFNSQFRTTVLATSIPWIVGNLSEAALRSAVARAGPRSYITGVRALRELKRMDPEAWEMVMARTVAGGHFLFARRGGSRYTNAEQFYGTRYEAIADQMAAFRRAPGARHAAGLWNAYTEVVFNQLNGRIEHNFQVAMLGRAIHDSPLMDGHAFKLSRKAINQAARGLRETPTMIEMGRAVDRMYGQYGKFPPGKRTAIAYYTPFVAWTINATKFLYSVLPKDHPVMTALLVSAEQATEEWRKDRGLDLFIEGAVPSFLQGSIPGRTKNYPVSRFTPFGIGQGGVIDAWANAVLPQVMGALDIGRHSIDWKGHQLRHADGRPFDPIDQGVAIGMSLVTSTIPVIGIAGRIHEKGPTAVIGGIAGYPKTDTPASGPAVTRSLPGVSKGEVDALQREAQSGSGISPEELKALRRQAGGG